MKGKLVYLACPYSGNWLQMIIRFWLVTKAAAILMKRGYVVFSPITQSHWTSYWLPGHRKDHDFWMKQDLPILERFDELWVLKLKGWKISWGVQSEIAFCKEKNKKVVYWDGKAEV